MDLHLSFSQHGANIAPSAEEAESSRKGLKGPKNMRYNGGMPTDLATDDADERVRLALDVLDSRLKVPTLEMGETNETISMQAHVDHRLSSRLRQ